MHDCKHPRKHPNRKPQTSKRSATFLASKTPPSGPLMDEFSLCGIRIEANVDSARTAINPSWNICALTVCAAAAVPVASIVRMALMTAMNVMFCAIDRNCTAAPPTISFPMLLQDGTRNRLVTVTIFRFNIVLMYIAAEVTSDALVASAAPATPKAFMEPIPNIKIGSNTRLIICAATVIFIGVVTSSVPRNAANPTVEMIAGMNVSARYPMYGAACTAVGVPGTMPTIDKHLSCMNVRRSMPKSPTNEATKIASPVARCTSSVSPDAAAFATTGAIIDGTKEMIQNAL
mmetsp:Transcript_9959/g.36977  ORF Transcript_9959/g.36977 Transcript_9959/m.36977 type:complete len:289 (+) Transcript_9959:1283-2149(+)